MNVENNNKNENVNDEKTIITIMWVLYFAGIFTGGLTTLVGLIIAYLKINKTQDSVIINHIKAAIKIFWYELMWVIVALVIAIIGLKAGSFFIEFVVWIILMISSIWFFYCCIKGFVRILDYDYYSKKLNHNK